MDWFPLILALMVVVDVLNILALYLHLRRWRVLGLLDGPYYAVSLTLLVAGLNINLVYSYLSTSYPFLNLSLITSWALAFMFAALYGFGSVLIIERRVDHKWLYEQVKEIKRRGEIGLVDMFLSRYPEDLVEEVRKRRKPVSLGVLACHGCLWASLLIGVAVAASPIMWLPAPGQPGVPPIVLDFRLILFAVCTLLLLPLGLIVLSTRWPYTGLVVILLSLVMFLSLIHVPAFLPFSFALLALMTGGGAAPLYRGPVKPSEEAAGLEEAEMERERLRLLLAGVGLSAAGAAASAMALLLAARLLPLLPGLTLPLLLGLASPPLQVLGVVLTVKARWRTGGAAVLAGGVLSLPLAAGVVGLAGGAALLVGGRDGRGEEAASPSFRRDLAVYVGGGLTLIGGLAGFAYSSLYAMVMVLVAAALEMLGIPAAMVILWCILFVACSILQVAAGMLIATGREWPWSCLLAVACGLLTSIFLVGLLPLAGGIIGLLSNPFSTNQPEEREEEGGKRGGEEKGGFRIGMASLPSSSIDASIYLCTTS